MFSKSKLIVSFLCVAALAGCATKPATFAQKDPGVDLYAFKTFAFFPPAAGQANRSGYTTLVGEQLKLATRTQLERLGYVYDERNPQLRVNIVLAVQQRAEVRSTPGNGPLPYRAWSASQVETVEYRQGTLAIDLVDAQRRTMVWRGVAQDRITRKDLQKTDETVRRAVREVFENYPRKAA
jgi:hypothetical protein